MTAEQFALGQWLFVKGIALSYFFAFSSLAMQVKGLFGKMGILSVRDLLFRIGEGVKEKRWFYVPTLFWFRTEDRWLQGAAYLGTLASLLLFLGFFPAPLLFLLWILYLSFVSVGSPFLHYQWDVLLLELGFAAIFFALLSPPPLFLLFWLWILAFRFILASGLVKLLSRCPEWWSLRAMGFHFETQPLPNFGGYLAHQIFCYCPAYTTFLVYLFEIGVPFLFLGSDAMRAWGALLSIFFQLCIMATGNYAFFNLLTITLCCTLFSDTYLKWLLPLYAPLPSLPPYIPLEMLLNALGIVMIVLNLLTFVRLFKEIRWMPALFRTLSRFYIVNGYGLFARMTTIRNEVVLEGSDDGVHWKEYGFRYKPTALNGFPRQIAPFQPRLDWQLWFSALTPHPQDSWWMSFILRLLQGSPDVEKLLGANPFPKAPPRFLRAHLYRYRFNPLSVLLKSGNFWSRTYVGAYMRLTSLKQ